MTEYTLSIGPPRILNDDFISELPLNQREWHEQQICPICKRLVYIYRHHKGLCEHLESAKQKEQKVAQDAIRKANRK